MLLPAALLVVWLGASPPAPVPVSLEVSRELHAQLDVAVLEARLAEEGFTLASQADARVRLVVARHPRGVELMAFAGAVRLSRLVDAPDEVWPVERTFELSQRLASLAHEAADASAAEPPSPSPVEPPAASPGAAPVPEPAPPLQARSVGPPKTGLLLRAGALVRAGGVDFTAQVLGALKLGRLEPALALGLVVAPGAGGMALEFPLLGGVRVVFEPGSGWTLTPEVLLGARLHWFRLGDGVVRVDPALQVGLSARQQLFAGAALGLGAAAFVATARTHLAGEAVLWERGVVGLLVTADVEF